MTYQRKALSKSKRFEVFKRDGFTCQYCGAQPPKVILHADHIHPVSKGGTNDIDNLTTACSNCNLGKSATPLSVIPQSLKDKAVEIAEREEQIAAFAAIIQVKKDRLDEQAWDIAESLRICYDDGSCSRAYLTSIKNFIEKLIVYEVQDAVEITLQNKGCSGRDTRFRYFCGVCWNKIRTVENG